MSPFHGLYEGRPQYFYNVDDQGREGQKGYSKIARNTHPTFGCEGGHVDSW